MAKEKTYKYEVYVQIPSEVKLTMESKRELDEQEIENLINENIDAVEYLGGDARVEFNDTDEVEFDVEELMLHTDWLEVTMP